MGEWADTFIDRILDRGYSLTPVRSKKQKRRDRQRKAKSAMRTCQFCEKSPLFFHEYEKDKWILAEWDENNLPIRHVCKLKERFNRVRFSF